MARKENVKSLAQLALIVKRNRDAEQNHSDKACDYKEEIDKLKKQIEKLDNLAYNEIVMAQKAMAKAIKAEKDYMYSLTGKRNSTYLEKYDALYKPYNIKSMDIGDITRNRR